MLVQLNKAVQTYNFSVLRRPGRQARVLHSGHTGTVPGSKTSISHGELAKDDACTDFPHSCAQKLSSESPWFFQLTFM
jgi:hypothetical protein